MSYFQVEFSKKDNGWIPKKQGTDYIYRRVVKSPSFSTIEETENWIRENYKPKKYRLDRQPWIVHKIGSYIGHLILIDEWKECCDDGFFIDDDGYGNPIDENYNFIEITDSDDYEGNHIWPSDYTKLGGDKIPLETKYILWYNR